MELRFGAIAKYEIDLYKGLVFVPLSLINRAIEFGVNDARCQYLAKIIYNQGGRYDVLFFDFGFSVSDSHFVNF